MLRFASLLPPAPFDEELASQGWYSAVYKQHSDRGLAELEAKEKPQSEELAAFHKLNDLGVLTQSDFFSPSKAKTGFYSNLLKSNGFTTRANTKRDSRSGGETPKAVAQYRRQRHKAG